MRALRGATPLGVVVFSVALAAILTIAARELSARAGFLVERPTVLLVWLAGLLITGVAFAWAAGRSLRRVDSALALWLMVLTAAVLASPLLLMLLQHPSP
jgi:hypothetical protein